jgi:hypothetical protein
MPMRRTEGVPVKDDTNSDLLNDIEVYCQCTGIAESTFGRRAINDGKLCARLRDGKSVTLSTARKVRDFIREHSPDQSSTPVGAIKRATAVAPASTPIAAVPDRPLRFYDNRQKYLAFVNTCNEKRTIADRATRELTHLRPTPPAVRLFDAGMGDGAVLSNVMRAMHQRYPTLPHYVVGKEISLEDVRLSLEKLPDRFVEHPASVVVFTNLHYAEAPWLMPRDVNKAAALNWREVELEGTSAYEYGQQLGDIDDFLVDAWQTSASPKTGNPLYVRPSVMIMYRKDHKFLLDSIVPRPGRVGANYDLVVASQPWRARTGADFKVRHVLAPLVRALGPAGRLLAVQSFGRDPGLEIVQKIWPDEDPFTVNRHELLKSLKDSLGNESKNFNFNAFSDSKALLKYRMHTLPDEIASSIGTSTLFAAWNAAIYVAQIEDQKLEEAMLSHDHLDATAEVLHKHNGLWFNDESFVVSRRSN